MVPISLNSVVDKNIAVHRNSGSDRSAELRDKYGLGQIVGQPIHRWHLNLLSMHFNIVWSVLRI